MTTTTPISELMTRNPHALAPNDTMDLAEKLFEKHQIHHVPIVENDRLVGMVTYADFLKIVREIFGGKDEIHKNNLIKGSITASEIMSKDLFCLAPDDTLGDAVKMMRSKRVNALPVLEKGRLVGIVTVHDMLGALEELLGKA